MIIKLLSIKKTFVMLLFFSIFVIFGCSGGNGSEDQNSESIEQTSIITTTNSNSTINWYVPAVSATWQWQLSGTINTNYDVDIYDIDLFDSSVSVIEELQASGKKVICYFSAGSYEEWRDDASSFVAADLGKALDGWEGERWLDVRSNNVKSIMESRLDLAKEKGCDAVEPDNMDGYANKPEFDFTADDQLVYNRFIAEAAHERLLGVGLKNDLAQIKDLISYFDFAINEQCFEYDECNMLIPFINSGKAVFNTEYKDVYVNDTETRTSLCIDALNMNFSTLILPLNLDDEFRFICK